MITVPSSGSCLQNQFQYCINVAGDTSAMACGLVVVTYTDCVCGGAIDVVYVLQLSGNTYGATNVNIVNFIKNSAGRLALSPTGLNAGIVHFGTTAVQFQTLTGDAALVTGGVMTELKKVNPTGETNIINGINAGIAMAIASPRDVGAFKKSPKVLVVLSDGLPTAPCSGACSNCTCTSCGTGGTAKTVLGNCTPWNPTTGGHFCMPCADPVPLASQVNSFYTRATKGSNWKLISYGYGDFLYTYNQAGWKVVTGMNYDPTKSLANPWNDLKTAVPALTDAICNIA
jgi:hypothetical protein